MENRLGHADDRSLILDGECVGVPPALIHFISPQIILYLSFCFRFCESTLPADQTPLRQRTEFLKKMFLFARN